MDGESINPSQAKSRDATSKTRDINEITTRNKDGVFLLSQSIVVARVCAWGLQIGEVPDSARATTALFILISGESNLMFDIL